MKSKKNERRGKFIVFEGLDGSGTTTQSKLLGQYLEKQNWPVLNTSEPTQGPMGLILRLLLTNRLIFNSRPSEQGNQELEILSNSSIALLFAADRLDHIQHTILPKIQDGVIVICERYYFSSYAYQMGKDSKNLKWLQTINSRCIQPDLTIYLNTSLAVCNKRRFTNRWYQDLYEKPEILEQVARNYEHVVQRMKKTMPVEIVDGTPNEKVVFENIIQIIQQRFPEMFPNSSLFSENQ
ncbi:MAG: dTMP kinase [Candidatus Brocadiae bacterium]|nr:dTMP kinase [Candidatus Brocadiia bacterium]